MRAWEACVLSCRDLHVPSISQDLVVFKPVLSVSLL